MISSPSALISKIQISKIRVIALIFFGVALQIQLSLFISDSYTGLRISLADIALPIIGLIILYSLWQKTSLWPQYHIKNPYLWLIGLGGIFIAALMHGYLLYDQWSHWGLLNRTFGWIILSCYFLLGGWLATNIKSEQLFLFIKITLWFFVISAIALCLFMTLQQYDVLTYIYPLSGFMANKNAFIFLALSLLALATNFQAGLFPKWLIYIFWLLLPLIFVYSGARAGIVAFPFLCLFLFMTNRQAPWSKIILSFIAGLFCVLFTHYTAPQKILFLHKEQLTSTSYLGKAISGKTIISIEEEIPHKGDSLRLKILDTTLNMVKERPILGSGLGAAKYEQEKQWGRFLNIIDCTPLWLWAETGLIGLSAFLIFYFLCLRRLWQSGANQENDDTARKLNRTVFAILIVFGVMCLFHEILYTRFLWFFMGLALAYPLNKDASGAA